MFLNIAVPQCTTDLGPKKVAVAAIATASLSSLRILSKQGQVVQFRAFTRGCFLFIYLFLN